MNPYYDSGKLGWEVASIDTGGSYEFDIIAFWRTPEGLIFTAADSG